jgi:hypothetical protein
VNAVKRADIRDFIADQLDRWKPATALNRYRSLQAFFKWCLAEGELDTSPMVGMKPPQLPDEPPPVLTDDQLRRLLKSCDGRGSPWSCQSGETAGPFGAGAIRVASPGVARSRAAQPLSSARSARSAFPPPRSPNSRLAASR